jgi:crotonobetainyl-CoA:carnitine CoA-transferase CaiB-like acyl-CoA transferase
MIQSITLPSGASLKVPAVMPKLSETPGYIAGGGPALGEHTDKVLADLGIDAEARKCLRQRGII